MRVRGRAGRCVDGADSSGLRGVSNGNCAKDEDAETSTAAPATMMSAAIRLTVPHPSKGPTLAYRSTAVNARAPLMRETAWPALRPRLELCAMADPKFSDPLAWRTVKAPSLEEIEALADTAFRRLPQKFQSLCEGLVIRVEDFPAEEVLDEMGAESEFDLLGLFQGVGLPFRSESAPGQMPNMVWLYRRPILDYWAEHDEPLGTIITHVLVHEIGHHFGLSDDDMAAIEASVT
jgi:predicted Zn-dependent protease with MMP-like domain